MGDGYRGQTEPFAAIIAVAALAVGLSLYAVASEDVLSELGSDEPGEEAVLEMVWQSVSEDGIIRTDQQSLSATLVGTTPAKPACITLAVVTGDGTQTVIEEIHLSEDGGPTAAIDHSGCNQSDSIDSAAEPQTHQNDRVSRTVPVQLAPGEIRPGTLHIEVPP